MTDNGPAEQQWRQPNFNVPLWKRPIIWIGALAAAGVVSLVVTFSANSNHSDQTIESPSPAVSNTYTPPSAVPTETVTFTPEASPAVTVTTSPTSSPSETQPTDDPGSDNGTILFNAKGKNGGQLSAPAVTWGEGYRNIIRFTCKNSIVTAGLTVHNPEGKTVKKYDQSKLKWIYPRPCIGDAVNDNLPKHPSEYYPSLLGLIIAKQ